MSIRPIKVPKYRLHKGSGQAAVTINGKAHYLGKYGTLESHELYRKVVGQFLAEQGRPPLPARDNVALLAIKRNRKPITVVEACTEYLRFCQANRPNEVSAVESMQAVFVTTFRHELAANIGPLALKQVREAMVNSGHLLAKQKSDRKSGKKSKRQPTPWSRRYVNEQIGRLKQMYSWLVENELLPADVANALKFVRGLREGEAGTQDNDPIGPVDDSVVDATLPFLPDVVADMVRLQRLTGMRPGEICQLRPCDIDRQADIWKFEPRKHKTQHHGKKRVVFLGPNAQAILLKYLARDAESHCFSPADSEAKRRVARGRGTKGVVYATKYNACTYRRAIVRAAAKAQVEQWAPNRLRHSAGTEVRQKFGLEAAQVVLGHSRADVTQIYAERDYEKAIAVARAIG